MAERGKKRANSGSIKPGQVRNPRGAGAHDPETRALRQLTKERIAEIGSDIVQSDIVTLIKIRDDANSNALKATIAAIMLSAHARADMQKLDALLDRLIGKVHQQVGLALPGGVSAHYVIGVPSNGREVVVEPPNGG